MHIFVVVCFLYPSSHSLQLGPVYSALHLHESPEDVCVPMLLHAKSMNHKILFIILHKTFKNIKVVQPFNARLLPRKHCLA